MKGIIDRLTKDVLDTLIIILASIVLILGGLVISEGVGIGNKCLGYGYPDIRIAVTITGIDGYCVREENEYEIVVPLDELEE